MFCVCGIPGYLHLYLFFIELSALQMMHMNCQALYALNKNVSMYSFLCALRLKSPCRIKFEFA